MKNPDGLMEIIWINFNTFYKSVYFWKYLLNYL